MNRIRCFNKQCIYNSINGLDDILKNDNYNVCLAITIAISSNNQCLEYENKEDYE